MGKTFHHVHEIYTHNEIVRYPVIHENLLNSDIDILMISQNNQISTNNTGKIKINVMVYGYKINKTSLVLMLITLYVSQMVLYSLFV
jgi:hypothetical protein